MHERLKEVPRVDEVLEAAQEAGLVERLGRPLVLEAVRAVLEDCRASIRGGGPAPAGPAHLVEAVEERTRAWLAPRLCRVINATGIILHTGLGRAALPREAVEALARHAAGYCLLEVDRAGERTRREDPCAERLCRLTGAEAATVVNNNAGATLLALRALAAGREVLVSHGQLVEIGGSFRIPEVMEESGARLVAVGTTNRTYLGDYERAVTDRTALLLRVHASNYRVVGFTHETGIDELVGLGRRLGLPVMDDLGSGCMQELAPWGLEGEPLVSASVRAGADLVCFSGDKLLGGPQAGICLGRRETVDRLRLHPLFRALRVDKLTLAALEAVLGIYLQGEEAARSRLPVLRSIAATVEDLSREASALAAALREQLPGLELEVVEETAQVGGGSTPARELPTRCVALAHPERGAADLAAALRSGTPPVFVRVKHGRVLLDLRTLLPGDAADLVAAVAALG
ncbi:MAG: L-seryl-tRNA(Sec) selenium transferase [Planctomycetes bacterium]|nr:L-seryl-tRNA(Sec) selenium transferase [Planctomycetota bacterium]